MKINREQGIIGAILVAIVIFSAGVTLGANVLGRETCRSPLDFLTMLGSWASAAGTLIAVIAALHIATKQNNIATLGKKEEIYNAFFELKMHMQQKMQHASSSEVSRFYHYARSAKSHLPTSLANDIENFFNACFEVAHICSINGGVTRESGHEAQPHLKVVKELAPKIEIELGNLLQYART